MAERRGLGQAMAMTPEKLAFIQGTPVVPPQISPVVEISVPAVEAAPKAVLDMNEPAEEQVRRARPKPVRASRSRETGATVDAKSQQRAEEGAFYGQILVPLTTRLQPRTADALRRACLEQKLARKTPNSQQEIVELALAQWLEQNGFA